MPTRITSTSFTNNFLTQINQLQQRQSQLQNQAATGLSVSLPEDNPQVMTLALNLQNSSSLNSQYESNINALQNSATTAYSAMNNLKSIIDRATEIATLASNGTTSDDQLNSYNAELQGMLKSALQVGNTQDAQGNYIFGGTETSSPPFQATTDSSGNITAVKYVGNSDVAQAEITQNVTVSAQTPGENTTGSGAQGLFADSRSGADIFSHLISLQQDVSAKNKTAISSTDAPALAKDEDNMVTQISMNGVVQSTLENADNIAAAQNTNFAAQISNATSVDLTTTLTQLTQTQTAYQAALQSGSMIFNLSLLDYLH